MEEIIIERDLKTAQITVAVNGVPGKACKALTAPIEAAFGVVTDVQETDEMRQRPKQTERDMGRQGSRESGRERGRA